MENNNQQLEARVAELERWKAEREKQQIVFPLDYQSLTILQKYFLHIISTINYTAGAGGNNFITYLAQQGNIIVQENPPSLVSYSVNVSTNYLTTNQISGNIKFFNDFLVSVATDGTPPIPLATGTDYYVINSDGYTFQLSLTQGGAAIDITTAGSGRQFIIN